MNNITQPQAAFSARPHILAVDDDARILDLVSRFLRENGFLVMTAANAADARVLLAHFMFDAVVADVMMPGETGMALTGFVRGTYNIPVILLTALGEAGDRIAGIESGADDYLPKPFEPRELVLRLRAILRRAPAKQTAPRVLRLGPWRFDPAREELQGAGDSETQSLTTADVTLLRALAAQNGQVISREDLAAACGLDAGERTIDVQVTRLRRKLEADTRQPRILLTVRGKGYMLRGEVR